MGYVRFSLAIAVLGVLSACAGPNNLGSNNLSSANLGTGIGPGSSAAGGHTVAGSVKSKETPAATARPVADTTSAFRGDKLIALTFDDGPRPYVLFGSKENNRG